MRADGVPTQGPADRSIVAGLVVAGVAHLLLLAALSLTTREPAKPLFPEPTPLEVSLVTEVAPEAQAPPAPTPPAPSIAPEQGVPEEAPPPPAPQPVARPEPRPEPVPAQSVPAKPVPVKPAPPVPAKPAPAPKPAPAQPQPRPQPAAAKPAPAKPAPAKPGPARPAASASRTDRLAGLASSIEAGSKPTATATRPRGARLGNDFLAGLSADAPSRTPSPAAPAARAGPYPTASIVQAIARQIQPCADRQVNPGPGANRIITTLNIRLNQDGTLAATPTRRAQKGVDDENERYAQRVVDLGIAAFKGCSPLKLPAQYYATESGGWNNINYQWQLR